MQLHMFDLSERSGYTELLEAVDLEVSNWTTHPAMINDFGVALDEVAILFRGQAMIGDFSVEAPGLGWKEFNVATDEVSTEPIESMYTIQYNFFEKEDKPYRLECMSLGFGGFSPLHETVFQHMQDTGMDAAIVHTSFKLYAVNNMRAWTSEFQSDGLMLAQRCQSTYGMFEYWVDPKLTYGSYLKPRVNLRDAQQES